MSKELPSAENSGAQDIHEVLSHFSTLDPIHLFVLFGIVALIVIGLVIYKTSNGKHKDGIEDEIKQVQEKFGSRIGNLEDGQKDLSHEQIMIKKELQDCNRKLDKILAFIDKKDM